MRWPGCALCSALPAKALRDDDLHRLIGRPSASDRIA
jgi:hypothetical protein